MRLALFFGVCLTFVLFVESFVEDEFVEDEENESRHHLRKVSYDFISQNGQTASRSMFQRKINFFRISQYVKLENLVNMVDFFKVR